MSGYLLLRLASCALSLSLATLVLSRAGGLVVNRLAGFMLLAAAQWSLCELMWNAQVDAQAAVVWMRLSVLGWASLGPLGFHVFVEMLGDRAAGLRRLVPLLYLASAASAVVCIATPWAIESAIPTGWGWGQVFGPLLAVTCAPTIVPSVVGLACWRRVHSVLGSQSERKRSMAAFVGAGVGLAASFVTDVLFPWMGVPVPGLGSLSLTAVGAMMVFNLQRYGYILLSPSAFAGQILHSLDDGVALANVDGRIHSANPALEDMSGAAPRALERKLAADLLPDLRPRRGDELCTQTARLRRVDGASLPVEVTTLPLRTTRGFVVGEALLVRDLREVVELRRRLVTAGRLAAVGELSAAISQEISQPVNVVLANLDLLRSEWDRSTGAVRGPSLAGLEKTVCEGEELIEECVEGVERVADVVREVQSFSRLDPKDRIHADLSELAERALRLAAPSAACGVSLRNELAPVPEVWCAPKKLERVILNLLLNAIHAVAGEGTVRLGSEAEKGRVRIRIDDDGCGISASDRERIFDPFFTTKPLGEGTGLGLSISYHIVRSHGGEIRVESRVGEGSSFVIDLPASRA